MFGKRTVYEMIDSPQAVCALSHNSTIELVDNLSFRGAYLARTCLEVLADHPEQEGKIQRYLQNPKSRTKRSLDLEIKRTFRRIDGTDDDHDQKIRSKVEALHIFRHMEFLRVSFMYTELMLSHPNQKELFEIYHEMGALQHTLVQAARI